MGKGQKKLSRGRWREIVKRESDKFLNFEGTVCVNVSGGSGSAEAWGRCLQQYGRDRVIPVFADTNSEHDETYRFLKDCERVFSQTLHRLNDGRNIWDVFDQSGILRIANAGGACKASIELKQKPLAKFFKDCGADAIAVGIEFMEGERIDRFVEKISPVKVLFPLCAKPLLGECDIHEAVRSRGIEPPSVYEEGQPHNNSRKYGCILAGVNQWAADISLNPDGFEYAKKREQAFTEKTGFTICRDQSGGKTTPYPLGQIEQDAKGGKQFDRRWQSQCSCMEPQLKLFSEDDCFDL